MKSQISLLTVFAGAVLATGAVHAQQAPQSTMQQGAQSTTGTHTSSTRFRTHDGTIVQINASPGTVAAAGPAPAFAQLDRNGDGSIDHDEAAAYSLLADDFNYADSNHNGAISKSEYDRWVKLP